MDTLAQQDQKMAESAKKQMRTLEQEMMKQKLEKYKEELS